MISLTYPFESLRVPDLSRALAGRVANPIKFSRSGLGGHTADVIKEVPGMDDAEIDKPEKEGIIA